MLAPLNQLLQKQAEWAWGDKQKQAFQLSKQLLLSSQILAHFDPKIDIMLACDASAYGISAVLSHRLADGSENLLVLLQGHYQLLRKNILRQKKKAWLVFLESIALGHICMDIVFH